MLTEKRHQPTTRPRQFTPAAAAAPTPPPAPPAPVAEPAAAAGGGGGGGDEEEEIDESDPLWIITLQVCGRKRGGAPRPARFTERNTQRKLSQKGDGDDDIDDALRRQRRHNRDPIVFHKR